MKKSFLILLFTSLLSLSGCGNGETPTPTPSPTPTPCSHTDDNHDHNCDKCKEKLSDHTYVYFEKDTHKCSYCGDVQNCIDANTDKVCDVCGHKKEVATKEIVYTTYGDSYKQNFTNGTQFGSDHSANVTKLTDFLNNQTTEDKIISKLECVSCNSLDDENKDGVRYFTIGSGKNGGSITFTTTADIYKIEVEAINYHNKYSSGSYSGENIDSKAHLFIDDEDFSLEVEEGIQPTVVNCTMEYSDPVKSFKLSTKDAEKCRVFIRLITITYAK